MPDVRVEPAALRAAAARIERTVAAVDAVRARLAGAVLTTASAATELLQRGYGGLQGALLGASATHAGTPRTPAPPLLVDLDEIHLIRR